MSDAERAEAAARVLADAVAGLACELTGQPLGEIALLMRINVDPEFVGFTWDWFWRPLGASQSAGGMLGGRAVQKPHPGLHAPRPRITI